MVGLTYCGRVMLPRVCRVKLDVIIGMRVRGFNVIFKKIGPITISYAETFDRTE